MCRISANLLLSNIKKKYLFLVNSQEHKKNTRLELNITNIEINVVQYLPNKQPIIL